jgi:hypothetical protein
MNPLCIDCINYKVGSNVKDDMCAHYAEFEMVRGEPNIVDLCIIERSLIGRCRPQGLNFKPMKPVITAKPLTKHKKA